jgi:ribose transport system substrate-binding protein
MSYPGQSFIVRSDYCDGETLRWLAVRESISVDSGIDAMMKPAQILFRSFRRDTLSSMLIFACAALLGLTGCQHEERVEIAVIPRTSGAMMWEPEHVGAQATALKLGARVYWNAPTREDDIEGQIALVQRVSLENYQGIILAPDQSRALITPVRRAMLRGLSVVVIGSPLPIPPDDRLSYVLNDEEAGGRIAGERLASVLHCQGSVAILGIDRDIAGIVARARSLEQFLATACPAVRVVKKDGSFNIPHEQQVAEETLRANPDLDAVVALTATSTFGALSALKSIPTRRRVHVIGFDPDTLLRLENPNLDSLVLEDTQKMGAEGVRLIVDKIHGVSGPPVTQIEPVLVTRENLNSPEVRQLTSMDWRPEPFTPTLRVVQ